MTDIDYEALGDVADDSYCNPNHTLSDLARAVVAALHDQGFVVVRADVLRDAVNESRRLPPMIAASFDRLAAALAAPGDGETS